MGERLLTRAYHRGTPEQRFTARVVRSDDPDGCWEWNGYRYSRSAGSSPGGYGKFAISTSCSVLAHRFSYELWVGPIPDGHILHHRCENPPCVNPSHLYPVPDGDHQRDHVLARGFVRNQYGTHAVR